MKKLLTLLLAVFMSLSLVVLGGKAVKAEDEVPVEEPKQTEVAAPVQAAQAVQAGQVATQETNEIHISTLGHLEFLFNNQSAGANATGILDNDIVIDNDSQYSTFSLQVYGNRTLDLNGHNIIVKKTMLFEAPDTTGRTIKIVNSDDNNDSCIKPASGANIQALVATRSGIGAQPFTLQIGDYENGYSGKIVFDGNNKSIAGLGVGLNWSGIILAVPGNKDNVVVKNTDFMNFKPGNYAAGIAIANIGADLDLIGVNITNASLGIATGDVVGTGNITPSETDLTNVSIDNCSVGIGDGDKNSLNANNVKTNVLALQGTIIKNCDIGIRFEYPTLQDNASTAYLMFQGGCQVHQNNKNVDLINASGDAGVIEFTEPGGGTADDFVGLYLEKVLNVGDECKLFKTNKTAVAYLENTDYILRSGIIDQNDVSSYTGIAKKLAPGAEGTTEPETPTTISKGSKVSFFVYVPDSITDPANLFLYDPNMDRVYSVEKEIVTNQTNGTNKWRVSFTPENPGDYRVGYVISGSAMYLTTAITISFPSPSPDPDPTYESCEKVIGPTWHWNESKGICEDVGVVGTATR